MTVRIASLEAMQALGAALADVAQPGDVIALSGDLGAGKSTLARAILKAMGFAGEVPSPTFALILPYDPPEVRIPVIHADFYRLDGAMELDELGLDAGEPALLIAEWPERVGGLAGPDTLELRIAGTDASERAITAQAGVRWQARWQQIAGGRF
ncbi:tRNA (adenosine(37)-N6)-threonylcarbamoyltransferase complex ATPase subunit type 1 TsaE [Blastomonas sp.]|uniref:tRNA (adenosine(37)-N6)-threonylcarbamoyltransferase complex ATPase subunit type 1 TsaE n=1 Tax=Blastomonas sp. TaxID=1909299 RepID=UPI00262EC52C|nr:tRNA (adenosine(37)-N6)-threonylcarbamoyltransferase complex ATPase subunit type 1 TsaE [Blastomonas sp.]MDM7954849.1 tRNA (adenosine(37)-N6)-threonylcarbamoyltransferase complex ATPase subunit type 1 TsaE [Blastomonas sp.]